MRLQFEPGQKYAVFRTGDCKGKYTAQLTCVTRGKTVAGFVDDEDNHITLPFTKANVLKNKIVPITEPEIIGQPIVEEYKTQDMAIGDGFRLFAEHKYRK